MANYKGCKTFARQSKLEEVLLSSKTYLNKKGIISGQPTYFTDYKQQHRSTVVQREGLRWEGQNNNGEVLFS